MNKPAMLLKWQDESHANPIDRIKAAHIIRENRRANRALRIVVKRMHGETYIGSDFLNVACCIYRATQ